MRQLEQCGKYRRGEWSKADRNNANANAAPRLYPCLYDFAGIFSRSPSLFYLVDSIHLLMSLCGILPLLSLDRRRTRVFQYLLIRDMLMRVGVGFWLHCVGFSFLFFFFPLYYLSLFLFPPVFFLLFIFLSFVFSLGFRCYTAFSLLLFQIFLSVCAGHTWIFICFFYIYKHSISLHAVLPVRQFPSSVIAPFLF